MIKFIALFVIALFVLIMCWGLYIGWIIFMLAIKYVFYAVIIAGLVWLWMKAKKN